MNKKLYLSFFFLAAAQIGLTQSSFLPKNLGPVVNSSYDDINPVISPDGKTLFFVRVNHPENTYGAFDSEDIWFAKALTDSTWTSPQRIPNLNNARYNAVLSISGDGKTILLNGVFNKKGTMWKKRGLSTSLSTGDGWATPQKIKIKRLNRKNAGLKSSGAMSWDGRAIVLSLGSNYNVKKNNLYVIRRTDSDKWGKPKKIKSLNTSSSEDAPFLAPDGKTLYFSSDRGAKDQYDIYKTTKKSSEWDEWTEPKPLSDTINSKGWDGYLRTTKTGSWAYFSSNNKSIGGADIYKVKLFEENPFVVVFGKVLNGETKAPITGKEYKVSAGGSAIDSIRLNYDSGTYKVKLPLNKLHTLAASLEKYTSQNAEVDVRGVREFTRKEMDLTLTPLPYVLVRGKLLIKGSGEPVPSTANPKVWINNSQSDSVKVDASASSYTVKLNRSRAHQLKLTADRFDSSPQNLDLTSVYEYQEMTFDLYVEEEKMVTVTGKILDKKTASPLKNSKTAKVLVEGYSTATVVIDTLQSTYELRLPPGNKYTISASAPNYYPLYESIEADVNSGGSKIYRDLTIVPIEVGQSIRLNNIFFDPAKASLKSESFAELDRVVEFFNASPDIKVEIAGHTDNVGNAAGNLKLSQARAQAVADYIIKKGIDKNRIKAKGYGLSKPIASNATKEGKAQNRRVEFTILDK